MSRAIIFILLSFYHSVSNSQEHFRCRVDTHLDVVFPSAPDSIYQGGAKVFYLNTSGLSFQAMVQDSLLLNLSSDRELQDALKGMYKGYQNRLPQLWLTRKDTALGSIRGIFLSGKGEGGTTELKELHAFLTVVNNHAYFIQTIAFDETGNHEMVSNFFNSIRFSGTNYSEEGIAYQTGYVLGLFGCIALVVGGVVLLIRRYA